jgi:hypothetical protein
VRDVPATGRSPGDTKTANLDSHCIHRFKHFPLKRIGQSGFSSTVIGSSLIWHVRCITDGTTETREQYEMLREIHHQTKSK